jgi:hypothetical protein
MLIEASITAGIRPTSMILHTQPNKRWDEFDFLCIEAHQIVLNERCGQCGLPRWICHNEDPDMGFKAIQDTCFAMKEIEILDERKSSNKDYKAPKGTKTRPEPYLYGGGEISGEHREAYYKVEWAKKNPESSLDVG